jgi:hypothetical protein
MALFSWLSPSPEKKIAKAQGFLDNKLYVKARDAAEGIDSELAEEIRKAALRGLRDLNIREAIGLANALEFERAQEHLDLAENFDQGGDNKLQEARGEVRRLRTNAPAPKKRSAGAAGSSPFGGGGGGVSDGAGADEIPEPDENNLWSLPPDDPRLAVAITLETYPAELREKFLALGGKFAGILALIDKGEAEAAVEQLTPYIESEPAVRFERSRAAQAAGKLPLAGSDLATWGQEFGHQLVGPSHTAALLAQIYAEQGRLEDGLRVVIAQLKIEAGQRQLRGTMATLLEAVGRFSEADEVARKLVREVPSDLGLYRLMARCRIRGGKRIEAMQVLESSLKSNCTSGACGSQPFDVEAGRILARLYLEDRLDAKRATELMTLIKNNAKEMGWFDQYLEALVERNGGKADTDALAEGLLVGVGDKDPRRVLVEQAFGQQKSGETISTTL